MDIILLIVLVFQIKKLALRKGLPPRPWQVRLVVLWLLLEIFGILTGLTIHQEAIRAKQNVQQNVVLAGLLGVGLAFGGFLFLKYRLDKLPDAGKDWMDRLGQSGK